METKYIPYTFVKEGIYYFSRRVPKDIQEHYDTTRIAFSLRTKASHTAKIRSINASSKLGEYWQYLRIKKLDLPR